METKLIRLTEDDVETEQGQDALRKAGEIIRKGGLVAFPTETVYGLGGDALNPESSRKIYAAKGRPSDNPLIVHIAEMEMLSPIVEEIPAKAKQLADRFWPGPLTMIFNKSDKVPLETTGGLQTVAVRMPSDKVAMAFIKAADGYIAAPSANTSGRPSPTVAKYVAEDLDGKIEMILDGGQLCIGLESTIVDMTVEPPMILRPGYITKEMLEEVLGEVAVDKTLLDPTSKTAPKAPGMKYRHYAPKGELTIVDGESAKVVDWINAHAKEALEKGQKVGIICTDETKALYPQGVKKSVGNRQNEETVARELYRVLREFDDEGMEVMYSESFAESGIGVAIMNRLLKAAGHHVEHI
ncbi:MAG: threonylcarbamoyl-AMP synthase [Lachnospiraceae bacterium]|jgi:L-threonylcarbamoyladenylate synthase|nr:threonylcarbamoyl-AMP synthase [Lachnospiraceae bacterium]MCR5321160.1 threonylcarbamoyl-AMP synthase [Lachnospiraceae bacterium]